MNDKRLGPLGVGVSAATIAVAALLAFFVITSGPAKGTDNGLPPARPMTVGIAQVSSSGPQMKAVLVDAAAKAAKQSATVKVEVEGVKLVDPASVNEKPEPGEAHLHYRVDNGPIIATTETKLSFHGLTPGEHKFQVNLAANDHTPLGPTETLTVRVH